MGNFPVSAIAEKSSPADTGQIPEVIAPVDVLSRGADAERPTPRTGASDNPLPNVNIFGLVSQLHHQLSYTDYVSVHKGFAIRRGGLIDRFDNGFKPEGSGWIDVTNGAALHENGTLVLWGSGTPCTYLPTVTHRKYVAIADTGSRGWVLAIYEDETGATHLETIANPELPPATASGNVPIGTGWIAVAAGEIHAIALKSDGTAVGWGNNNVGQQDLPATVKYKAISADWMTTAGLSEDGTIYVAGGDSYCRFGIPAGSGFIKVIVNGDSSCLALSSEGAIRSWGLPVPDPRAGPAIPLPTGSGYTDISYELGGPGFAITELAPELHITGPISPGQQVSCRENSEVIIPPKSLFEHTHNGITRIIGPDGSEPFWENDDESSKVWFPSGVILPVSVIHYIPSGSHIDAKTDYRATVYIDKGINGNVIVMNVSENAWYDEKNPTLPRAIYFPDMGWSVGTTAKQQVFLSSPLSPPTNGGSPVLSDHQLSVTAWIGTIGILGSTNPADTRSVIIEKNNINRDQWINATLFSRNWGSDPNQAITLSTKASLTSENAVLKYSGFAQTSRPVARMELTPKIWRRELTGDVLVNTGDTTTCSEKDTCSLTGGFTPLWDVANLTGTFFANVTTIYTLPPGSANDLDTDKFAIIAPTETNEPVPEVVVTAPLSPVPPGTTVNPANANSNVPWGGKIEHVMDGTVPMTVVYDAEGQPQFRADDTKADYIPGPDGSQKRATFIHELPDESMIMYPEGPMSQAIVNLMDTRILTVKNTNCKKFF